jgi:hypothetical protein
LINRAGTGSPRLEIEAIITQLWREKREQLGAGCLWASMFEELEQMADRLFIPEDDFLERDVLTRIVDHILQFDVPAWRRHLTAKNKREWGDYDYGGPGGFLN